jgi:hypothetical protein
MGTLWRQRFAAEYFTQAELTALLTMVDMGFPTGEV